MFNIAKDKIESYEWPVKPEIPQDGGTHREARFWGRLKLLPVSEVEEIMRDLREDPTLIVEDRTIAERVLVGWRDVEGEDGEALPYTPEHKTALLDIPYVRSAVTRAYFESLGGKKARAKN